MYNNAKKFVVKLLLCLNLIQKFSFIYISVPYISSTFYILYEANSTHFIYSHIQLTSMSIENQISTRKV